MDDVMPIFDFSKPQICSNPKCGKPFRKTALGMYIPDCSCGYVEEQKETRKIETFDKTYKLSKLPSKYFNCTFDNIDQFNSEFINDAKKWLECGLKEKKSFFVQSNMSTGKSMICSIMGHECIKINKSVYFTKPIRIYNEIFNQHIDSSARIEFYKTVDILIIDDFTKGITGDWHKYVQFDILDERYENGLVTIGNTNEYEKDIGNKLGFETKLGMDLIERWKEMCGEYYLKFDNLKNYRI